MNVKTMDQELKNLAKNYLELENEILELIIQMDHSKGFYQLGYNSLFSYMTQSLKLSPAITYNFINVARKSMEVPRLKEQVVSGKISIYKAQKMTSVINEENQDRWFELAQKKTHRELEREVALASPGKSSPNRLKYVNSNESVEEKIKIKRDVPRVELQVGVSEQIMLKLRRAQDLESQRKKSNLDLEETLNEVLDIYLAKKDPVKRAQRQKNRGKLGANEIKKNFTAAKKFLDKNQQKILRKRETIPANIIHQVQLRDKGQCTHIDLSGHRCSSRRYLEIHHIQPVAQGGGNELDNLKLLCSGHHRALHSKSSDENPGI